MAQDNKIYVTGHQKPDTDCIAAAIGYAFYKRAQGLDAVACRLGRVNLESKYLLKKFHFSKPLLLKTAKVRMDEIDLDEPLTITSDLSILETVRKMEETGRESFAVTDGEGVLQGWISKTDIAKLALGDTETTREMLRQTSAEYFARAVNGKVVYDLEDNTLLPPAMMLDSLEHMLRQYKDTLFRNYIVEEPQSAYAYFALMQKLNHRYAQLTNDIFLMDDSIDGIAYRAVATCWKQFYPESERAQQLWNMVERHINTARKVAYQQQKLIDEGRISMANIIDLSLPDRRDNQRTLSELAGQVVLLDFHLFDSPESAARILKLRELYDRYHDRGLEIYQVSVDKNEFQWKQATASLPWICVFDPMEYSCMQYNVSAVPDFFLIDRNNALQLRSDQIEDIDKAIESLL